jgi:RimJ/RimL family protein N-acetyltransferase
MRGLPRVIADVDPRNVASLKLLGRLGFVEAGRFEAAPGWGKSAAFI